MRIIGSGFLATNLAGPLGRHDGSRLVYLSTSTVGLYGRRGSLLTEDGPVVPCSPYGRHKRAMEDVVRASGVDHLILRLAYPVGPYQPSHQFVPALTTQVRTGEVTVWRGAKRDLIDVVHVAAIVDALLTREVTNVSANIATGTGVPVDHLADHLAERLGVRPAITVVSVPEESEISVDRLHALVPEVAGFGFGPDYFRSVLDRYLPVRAAG
jgi:nucleoside-diphosphate-sugar epimerase